MSHLNRRQWLKKSAFTTSLLALGCRTNFEVKAANPPFQNGLIDTAPLPLHWNENPFGPSKKAVEAVTQVMAKANRYPDDMVAELKDISAKKYGVANSQVLLTNGSTEILGLVGQKKALVRISPQNRQ